MEIETFAVKITKYVIAHSFGFLSQTQLLYFPFKLKLN